MFVDFKPMQKFENESDMCGFRRTNNSTRKRVLEDRQSSRKRSVVELIVNLDLKQDILHRYAHLVLNRL